MSVRAPFRVRRRSNGIPALYSFGLDLKDVRQTPDGWPWWGHIFVWRYRFENLLERRVQAGAE